MSKPGKFTGEMDYRGSIIVPKSTNLDEIKKLIEISQQISFNKEKR